MIHIDGITTSGAFYKDSPSHTIHEFADNVHTGIAIKGMPTDLIYLSVINWKEIHNISMQTLDHELELVNFRGQEIIIRLQWNSWYNDTSIDDR